MIRIKYHRAPPPTTGELHAYTVNELRRIELALDAIHQLLKAEELSLTIEVGAPNSGGAGFRLLRIPN